MACFHGGAFWNALSLANSIGRERTINADVLDAWFDPAPSVVQALCDPWLYRTSPPTQARPMEHAVAQAFDLPPEAVLAGPGSSALIYLALREWLTPSSRVLLVEPTYGEYAHLCEDVIGCRVDRFQIPLRGTFDLDRWSNVATGYDLAVLVNPNNPSGHLIPTTDLISALPKGPRVLVDEAYLAYTGQLSTASFVADRPRLSVVRSFSKSHALSGLRSAALFAHPTVLAGLRPLCPPWWVSLPSQVATVQALPETSFYEARYTETHRLRRRLAESLPGEVVEGAANWVLLRLPEDGPTAAEVVRRCAAEDVYLRDAGATGASLGTRILRIAVKPEYERIVQLLRGIQIPSHA